MLPFHSGVYRLTFQVNRHFPEIIATCQFTLVILDILSVIEIPRTDYGFSKKWLA